MGAAESATLETVHLRRELRLVDLIFFNVLAVLGVQLIPSFAHVGPVAIPLHIIAACLFFVPCAWIVAKFSQLMPGEGGFYIWTRAAFGDWHGFVCGWSWWLSVLLFLPTLVVTAVEIAAEAMGMGHGGIASQSLWQILGSLALLWVAVGANILGLRVSKWLGNVGGAMLYGATFMMVLASLFVWLKGGSATSFVFDRAVTMNRVSLWAQIAFAYTGLELGSLMGGEVRQPKKTIPRAVWISAVASTAAYILGCVSLMVVLPPGIINPMSGMVQTASVVGLKLGWPHFGSLMGVLLFGGIMGKLSTWGGGSARLPFAAGLDGALPVAFTRIHPVWGTPWIALLFQGVVCSLFVVLTQAGETVRNGWQLLMDMEILASFVPFIYIFLMACKFREYWSGVAGFVITLVAMGFAVLPPEGNPAPWLFEMKVIGGCVLLLTLGAVAYWWAKRRSNPVRSL
jgi:amino acid transporter